MLSAVPHLNFATYQTEWLTFMQGSTCINSAPQTHTKCILLRLKVLLASPDSSALTQRMHSPALFFRLPFCLRTSELWISWRVL